MCVFTVFQKSRKKVPGVSIASGKGTENALPLAKNNTDAMKSQLINLPMKQAEFDIKIKNKRSQPDWKGLLVSVVQSGHKMIY